MNIKADVLKILQGIREDAPLNAFEENLFESGILDSMGIAQLVPALEVQFDIEIGLDDIEPENFATLEAVVSLVKAHKGDQL